MLAKYMQRRMVVGTGERVPSVVLRLQQGARDAKRITESGSVDCVGRDRPMCSNKRRSTDAVPCCIASGKQVARLSRSLLERLPEVDIDLSVSTSRAVEEVSRMTPAERFRLAWFASLESQQVAELLRVIERPNMVVRWRKECERRAVRVLRRRYGE